MMRFGDKAPADEPADPMADDAPPEGGGGDKLMAMAGKKAAGKVLAAIDSGDAAALDAALRAHYTACEGD